MKIIGLFLAVCFIAFAYANRLPEAEEKRIFNEYSKKYNIRVGRSGDGIRETFLKNYYEIQDHNEAFRNGTSSYEQEVNEFAHLTPSEFLASYTGYIPGSLNATVAPPPIRSARASTPSSFSWSSIGNIVGPATNQGACGSCTIFAVIGVMEAHMRIKYSIYDKLSEQETMQCCGGCNGGTNSYIYDFARNGVTYEWALRYAERNLEECNTKRIRARGSRVINYYRVQRGSNAVSDAMYQLAHKGPLATGLCLPGSINRYKSGVYDEENADCGWHALMIVGYGTENGKDYWLARNSWGPGFGENGFLKIRRGKNLCKIEDDFTYPNMGL